MCTPACTRAHGGGRASERARARSLARVAVVVGNYSGQLDIPRAYKHARTHAHGCRRSADPISDYARARPPSIANREGNPIARFWNTHDVASQSDARPTRRGPQAGDLSDTSTTEIAIIADTMNRLSTFAPASRCSFASRSVVHDNGGGYRCDRWTQSSAPTFFPFCLTRCASSFFAKSEMRPQERAMRSTCDELFTGLITR